MQLRKLSTDIVWVTPDGDNLIAQMARVSNPSNEKNTATAPKLIKYLIDNKHWSPFEMVHACVKINTTRDIGRQLLRHRSFSFQEFSQRYAQVQSSSEDYKLRECRLQDTKNRQSSIELDRNDVLQHGLNIQWQTRQQELLDAATDAYLWALNKGIAKEVARAVLPEGLTDTSMYMVGSLRSWIHFWEVRCHEHTQKETRLLAEETKFLVLKEFPSIKGALNEESY